MTQNADIAGAIVGGASGAISSYWDSGSVSWGAVGRGALIGVAAGSLGLVRILGGWISGLF